MREPPALQLLGGGRSAEHSDGRLFPRRALTSRACGHECLGRFPQGSFTLAMWVYPTPGISSGLGTVFAMNTATGDNVMSLSIDRGRNIYEYKVGERPC